MSVSASASKHGDGGTVDWIEAGGLAAAAAARHEAGSSAAATTFPCHRSINFINLIICHPCGDRITAPIQATYTPLQHSTMVE